MIECTGMIAVDDTNAPRVLVDAQSARADLYLAKVNRTLRPETHKDYKNILENTPELVVLKGVLVAAVTSFPTFGLMRRCLRTI